MGYHTREFEKGVFGEFSKIQEEWEELLDARLQGGKILELCELADLYGAIAGYVEKRFGMTMMDVAKMAEMTASAFKEGKRGSTEQVVMLVTKDEIHRSAREATERMIPEDERVDVFLGDKKLTIQGDPVLIDNAKAKPR